MSKKALITGISGQDGSYLAELLLSKGYEVYGVIRRSSSPNTPRIDHIRNRLGLHYGDLTDSLSINDIVYMVEPDEIYHLGAQSDVKISFNAPKYTTEVNALGTLYLLEAIRNHCPKVKFYNAATSELFGKATIFPQKEDTPFNPRSPYAIAKLFSYHLTKNYREAYNLFAVNGILFNHESERRGGNFVTKKIVNGLVNYIHTGESFSLGALNTKRDWGHASEYVEMMWKMLQQKKPEDFVIATGETHTIKEFIDECLLHLPRNTFIWKETMLWDNHWTNSLVIETEKQHYRPTDVDLLVGDSTKAKEKLGWAPKIKFRELVKIMMEDEMSML